MDYIKYQNHELKKANEQHQRELEGLDQQGFMDRLHAIYNEQFGTNKAKK